MSNLVTKAQNGDADAILQISYIYFSQRKYELALDFLELAVSHNHPYAAELYVDIYNNIKVIDKESGEEVVKFKLIDFKLPSLHTVNGMGFRIYGNADLDRTNHTCVKTHFFVFLFIPVFPTARYRVLDNNDGSYRFFEKLPLKRIDFLPLLLWIVFFVIL